MNKDVALNLNKVQKHVLWVISLGNTLEWYDFYLYIFLAKPLSNLFFPEESTFLHPFGVIGIFAIGFITRPFGGVFFGRLGDRIGRKKSFILSVVMMAASTFAMGFLPTYSQIGIIAPILLAILRILQTFPSGGELPGAFCYLYEAGPNNKKFMSSFAGIGNQIGIALAALDCYYFKNHFSEDFFLSWGWRMTFIIGGFIGLGSILLRYKLHETELFQKVVALPKMAQASIWKVFQGNWRGIIRGVFFGTAQTVSFHFISVLFPVYFFHLSGMNDFQSLIATLILLAITTFPLPLYGLLAERYNVKYLAIGSCLLLLSLLYPLHNALHLSSPQHALRVMGLFALCLACITALWPYFLSRLFPTPVRYTCVGLSFNIGDGVFGGLSSLFAYYFINAEKNFNTFIWIMFVGCLLSIASCIRMQSSKDETI